MLLQIINLSSDSFSGDGNLLAHQQQEIFRNAPKEVVAFDIGAESTRPGSSPLDHRQEWQRLKIFLENYCWQIPLSLDSRMPETVKKALYHSPDIKYINDVSGLQNPDMVRTLAEHAENDIKFIAMHNKGIPPIASKDIPDDFYPNGLLEDMKIFWNESIRLLHEYGLDHQRMILDPGFGFGKNLNQSLDLLDLIPLLKAEFGLEILVGASRKSFLRLWKNQLNASNEELDIWTHEFHGLCKADYYRVHSYPSGC